MGLLVEGIWQDRWYDTAATGGRFVRTTTTFRGAVGEGRHPLEAGRYHLYVAWACPWAHRTLLVRALKGLEHAVSVSVVHPLMLESGWVFSDTHPDHLGGRRALHEVYTAAEPRYTGRVTVPVLWDKVEGTIVNNESAEIVRLFNRAFDPLATRPCPDLYPEGLREEIDAVNERVYRGLNNGVYRAGFATTQAAYDEAVAEVFETLDWLEDRLSRQRFLVGDQPTEADWRLFPTIARFDLVYHGHFKCNRNRVVDMPHLWAWARERYRTPGVAGTLNFSETAQHYYGSHRGINPTGVVPVGPALDW